MALTAVDQAAATRGLTVGQRLADARALIPQLHTAAAAPDADAQDLNRLADWCHRYTPLAATDGLENGTAGLVLDITGCAHLCGGEAALIEDLLLRLARFGMAAHAAAADTPAAAYGWARFGQGARLEGSQSRARLAALPVEALRLDGEQVVQLRRLGLQTIGDIMALRRAPLATRFGEALLLRLDHMFGLRHEPISPRRPVPCWQTRVTFPDGIGRREDIDRATRHLLDELCAGLEKAGRGARSLTLDCYRLDGAVQTIAIGTGKPVCTVVHLMRLFGEKLGAIDPGFGIEVMILSATATDPLVLHQSDLTAHRAAHDLSDVIDRLKGRLGPKRVRCLVPRESHWPERAVRSAPALSSSDATPWLCARPRPVQLFTPPEPLEIGEHAEDGGAPRSFRWRRSDYRVLWAEGPERIEPEWWRGGGAESGRDYFWVQDGAGRRFWIYQNRNTDRGWYLHGLFA
jgi:protein ImuB